MNPLASQVMTLSIRFCGILERVDLIPGYATNIYENTFPIVW